jgi:hypothetical protein
MPEILGLEKTPELSLFWPLSEPVINFQPHQAFACTNPDKFAVKMKR